MRTNYIQFLLSNINSRNKRRIYATHATEHAEMIVVFTCRQLLNKHSNCLFKTTVKKKKKGAIIKCNFYDVKLSANFTSKSQKTKKKKR